MKAPDISIFVDTNCFLHLRDLKDLPWLDLFPKRKWVEIVVAPVVIEELDKKKNDRNNLRLRDRARQALSLIEAATIEPAHRLNLRDKSPRVTLRPDNPVVPDWAAYPNMDCNLNDDLLVIACIAHSGESTLLSYDSGPLIRARLNHQQAFKSPETWQLPDQPDDVSKEIARLKRELEDERSKKPRISLEFLLKNDAIYQLEIPILTLSALAENHCKALTKAYLAKHEKAKLQKLSVTPGIYRSVLLGGSAHSSFNSDSYERDYSEFSEKVLDYFRSLHRTVRILSFAPSIAVRVANDSSYTALNVLVDVEVSAGVRMATQSDWAATKEKIGPPVPPEPPSDRHRLFRDIMPPRLFADSPRDPTSFYWQDRPEDDRNYACCSKFCQEVRARSTSLLEFQLLLSTAPALHSINLTASATNIGAPVICSIALEIIASAVSWDDQKVNSLLEREIGKELADMVGG